MIAYDARISTFNPSAALKKDEELNENKELKVIE
jgi:hypothetical protein